MAFLDVLTYGIGVSIASGAALFIRRVYMGGSTGLRAGLRAGTLLVLGLALVIVIFGR